ncbi:uncharacterized protein C2845_PM08G23540 [Panicum miliaceum]|uniref:Uncharacterized protein n=1 Tax=Panicum miliaceum TaxID=4540 RepID=A0A3L6R1R2_PANMI|nr:uncharacterized protein C2845_PM08G23540 [Panicum miliaceum]
MERTDVDQLIVQVQLGFTPDERRSQLMGKDGKLHTSMLYALLQSANSGEGKALGFARNNHAPPRVRFFAGLLMSCATKFRVEALC